MTEEEWWPLISQAAVEMRVYHYVPNQVNLLLLSYNLGSVNTGSCLCFVRSGVKLFGKALMCIFDWVYAYHKSQIMKE